MVQTVKRLIQRFAKNDQLDKIAEIDGIERINKIDKNCQKSAKPTKLTKIHQKSESPSNLQIGGKSVLFFIYTTLSPLIIFVILVISWSNHAPLTKGDYEYPEWANGKLRKLMTYNIDKNIDEYSK